MLGSNGIGRCRSGKIISVIVVKASCHTARENGMVCHLSYYQENLEKKNNLEK